jgi:hypothetical protein
MIEKEQGVIKIPVKTQMCCTLKIIGLTVV